MDADAVREICGHGCGTVFLSGMCTMKRLSAIFLTAVFAAGIAIAQESKKEEAKKDGAEKKEEKEKPRASHFEAGVEYFFAGKMKEALVEWDAQVKEDPSSLAGHWQRGLALYYAERYQDGRAQFEEHQKVNPEDVENAVWHFLCVAKLESVEAARKVYSPITRDRRVPMKEIHALYAGSGSVEAVLKAAEAAEERTEAQVNMQRCYAHLYLGLYQEALGKTKEAKEHMLKAAALAPAQSYMGQVAVVHCKVRGWKAE